MKKYFYLRMQHNVDDMRNFEGVKHGIWWWCGAGQWLKFKAVVYFVCACRCVLSVADMKVSDSCGSC